MSISWQVLADLEKEYGDSFYLIDLRKFQDNYNEFLGAFRSIYPNTNIAYSYKTNYIPRLCQLVNSMGGYAEVVSRMEYDLALKIGVSPQKIIFNGPYKPKCDLEMTLLSGAVVNLDSPYEIDFVSQIARDFPEQKLRVGLRCNFDLGTSEISRFGFDVDSEEIGMVFGTLKSIDNCVIEGLHCHVMTPKRSAKDYAIVARRMLELVDKYFAEPPEFIDLGGGFFSKMSKELQKQFELRLPTFQEYAEAIATQFANIYSSTTTPQLILEPGIAITADIMQFVTKVIDIKTIRSRTIALVSGSIYNIKPTLNKKNLPIQIIGEHTALSSDGQNRLPLDIVGYSCMEHDVLYTSLDTPVFVNDYIVFSNVGSYTNVLKPPFIMPNPPIISYNTSNHCTEVIKRAEKMSDVFMTYQF